MGGSSSKPAEDSPKTIQARVNAYDRRIENAEKRLKKLSQIRVRNQQTRARIMGRRDELQRLVSNLQGKRQQVKTRRTDLERELYVVEREIADLLSTADELTRLRKTQNGNNRARTNKKLSNVKEQKEGKRPVRNSLRKELGTR